MKNIQVTIAGVSGAGTTTIAQFLQKCLAQVGIESTVEDTVGLLVSTDAAEQRAADLEATFQPRLKALLGREDFMVEIKTEQLKRIAL